MDTISQVLEVFLNNPNESISGQYISEKLSISRNAVWKAIEQLRKNDYIFESQTNKGYQLVKIPNKIDRYYLSIKLQNLCTEIIVQEKIESTNKLLKELADNGQADKTIIIAKEQSSGRGRLGRAWDSQEGGLWFSLLLRPDLPMEDLSLITLTMAAAVREGISSYTDLDVKIKWPNDILFNGKKLVGILTEVKGDMDRVEYIVVGIGVNVLNAIKDDLAVKATSLKDVAKSDILINDLLVFIVTSINHYYNEFVLGKTSEILTLNKIHSAIIGKEVEVSGIKGTEKGIAQDILQDGSLSIKVGSTTKKMVSGDVSLSSWY